MARGACWSCPCTPSTCVWDSNLWVARNALSGKRFLNYLAVDWVLTLATHLIQNSKNSLKCAPFGWARKSGGGGVWDSNWAESFQPVDIVEVEIGAGDQKSAGWVLGTIFGTGW